MRWRQLLNAWHSDWFSKWRTPPTLGERGEQAAAKYLKRKKYIIVARGDRTRLGEIDIVAVDGRTVVFVEVKTRRTHRAGHPAEAVDDEKQRRITRSALGFLKRHQLLDCRARFDVVAVTWPDDDAPPEIEHIPGAFEAKGPEGMFT